MTLAQLTGILRAIIAAVGGGLITKGIANAEQVSSLADNASTLIGLAITLGTAYWSHRSNSSSNLASQLSVSKAPLADQAGTTK